MEQTTTCLRRVRRERQRGRRQEDQTDDEDDLDWATDARYTEEEWRELFGESGDEEDFDGF